MNENIETNTENVDGRLDNNVSDPMPVTSNGNGDLSGANADGTSVSAGDASGTNTILYFLDDSGNYVPYSGNSTVLTSQSAEVQDLSSDDSLSALQEINYKLSIIIFLLLSFWIFQKIKNAVRGFTGRGID